LDVSASGQAPAADLPQVGAEGAAASAQSKTYDEEYVKDLRSQAAGYRTRLRELEAADATRKQEDEARKLAEMSEVERLKAQLAAAEVKARALEVRDIRRNAGIKHNLPDELLEFLTAEDEAGALAQAEKLAAKLATSSGLPAAGLRNPANGGDQAARISEAERVTDLRRRVPGVGRHVVRG
jgi:hypothetical protein